MNTDIKISRELAERLLADACNENWSELNQALNAPIACRECMGTGGIGRLETCKYCNGTGKITAPVVEYQEPVARIDGMYGDPEAFAEREIRPLCDVNKLKIGTLLYTSPPAPVVVVRYKTYITQPAESLAGMAARQLKDEKRWIEIRDANSLEFPDMCASDYYPVGSAILIPAPACLDKVKELNQ